MKVIADLNRLPFAFASVGIVLETVIDTRSQLLDESTLESC